MFGRRKFFGKRYEAVATDGSYEDAYELFTRPVSSLDEAQVVTSLNYDGLHEPVLDIDVPIAVVPSSTPGHCHLYLNVPPVTWDKYTVLLDALADCGIIEPGYADVSKRKGYTAVRVPWVGKHA